MWYILLQRRTYTSWYLSIAYLVFTYLTIVIDLYSSFEVNQFGVAGFIEAWARTSMRSSPRTAPLQVAPQHLGPPQRSRRRRRSLGPGLAPPHATRNESKLLHPQIET
jgi:hypothetical protein